ncbi:Deoxyuridine 5'-triphosphate nucleotidohydrolase [Dictyocoela muelleri]|nr:Deoxyuridine 5'-triphosphate nucleotidohydrolase [Dictyocoela muelleri]
MTTPYQCKALYDDSKMPLQKDNKLIFFAYEDKIIHPGEIQKIKTGVKTTFSNNYFAYINILDKHIDKKIKVLATDDKYNILINNKGDEPFSVNKGDEIATCHFVTVSSPELVVVSDLDETERGERGWGSTGKN